MVMSDYKFIVKNNKWPMDFEQWSLFVVNILGRQLILRIWVIVSYLWV
jgi:hypothetical protein